jgi:hypothetical protein
MPRTFNVPCPHCKTALLISHDDAATEPQPQDRLICPTHGDVGNYADFEPVIKNIGAEKAKEMIETLFRRS